MFVRARAPPGVIGLQVGFGGNSPARVGRGFDPHEIRVFDNKCIKFWKSF